MSRINIESNVPIPSRIYRSGVLRDTFKNMKNGDSFEFADGEMNVISLYLAAKRLGCKAVIRRVWRVDR